MNASTRLRIEDAAALAERALHELGYPSDDARTIVEHLLDCELRGLGYSGLARIVSIAERLAGAPPVTGSARATRKSPVSAQLDGDDRIGYLVALQATELAIDKAIASGIGIVGANGTWYTGMLSYYAERITAKGLVAMLASSATPWVAPFGGTEPRFGTNPFCFGFPAAESPLIWDIGISEIIHAQALLAHRTGSSLPAGVAYAQDGSPTTDPMAALAGAFAAWGGHKGSGLGVSVQLLGALAGAPLLPGEMRDFGFFVLAIDPELFGPRDELRRKVSRYQQLLAETRPANPEHPVRAPFARSAAERVRRLREGSLEVPSVVHTALTALAGS